MAGAQRELNELFLNHFTPDELKRVISRLAYGDRVLHSLPTQAPAASFAFEAMNALRRFGLIDRQLFEQLIEAKPPVANAIIRVASMFNVSGLTAPEDIPPQVAAPATAGSAKTKILYMSANPSSTKPIDLGEEVKAIQEAIRAATGRDQFEFVVRLAVNAQALRTELQQVAPDIVHFTGHGEGEDGLVFQDKRVTARMLRSIFENVRADAEDGIGRPVRCVLLNACLSMPQAEATREHVDCVVGMTASITDAAARRFATAFYSTLAEGRHVASAFRWARSSLEIEELDEEDIPTLLERTEGVARQIVFATSPSR